MLYCSFGSTCVVYLFVLLSPTFIYMREKNSNKIHSNVDDRTYCCSWTPSIQCFTRHQLMFSILYIISVIHALQYNLHRLEPNQTARRIV